MDDSAPVSRLDRLGDLAPDLQNLRDRQRTLVVQTALHGLAVEVLHDQVVDPVLGAHVVERADVVMLKLGDLLRLALQAFLESRVPAPLGAQHLDRDLSLEAGVAGLVDLSHAALAEQRDDLVGTQSGPGFEGQLLASYSCLSMQNGVAHLGTSGSWDHLELLRSQ